MNITEEMIQKAIEFDACSESIEWLRKAPRTWNELVEHNSGWAVWAMIYIPDFPIDLEGLHSDERARVMANRPDCPINLEGMGSFERSTVMARRTDCPINMETFHIDDRAWVMGHRADCPINFEGFKKVHIDFINHMRSGELYG